MTPINSTRAFFSLPTKIKAEQFYDQISAKFLEVICTIHWDDTHKYRVSVAYKDEGNLRGITDIYEDSYSTEVNND